MADSDRRIHVLLISYPTQGHINPLLQFGKRLAGYRNVRCTMAVTRSVLCSSEAPEPGAVHITGFSDGCDHGGYDEVGEEYAYLARLKSAGSDTLNELLRSESAQGRPVRVVAYDAFLVWVPGVARRHGASCAAFFTQACAVNILCAHAWASKVKLPMVNLPSELPGLSTELEPADFPSYLTRETSCLAYRDLLVQQCQGLDEADHVLINSFYELQAKEAQYMASRWGAKMVGPTVPSAYLDSRIPDDTSYGFHLYTPMAAETETWLHKMPADSVIYVSFGSLAAPGPEQMSQVAKALHDSGKAFLWVVRSSETSKIPEGFANKTKERGLIVTWCPQLTVLGHPAVGCFVTHCGWNSIMEGLCAGTPMVAMPQWSDQSTNAKYVEDVWRVGVRVRPDADKMVRKEELVRCLTQVMEGQTNKQYKSNAMKWSEKAKTAMSQGGSSDRNIMEFLENI